ncbi:bifunctional folylpolyglutamate synthase/dihydrofolate synthase [Pseudomonadota bacterium]
MKKLFWPPEFINKKEIVLGLERIKAILIKLKHPENKLPPVIHIAGTNGKGSILAFIKYILENQGYLVHRYTSPHLIEFNERIEIAGKQITDKYLTELLNECRDTSEKNNIPVTFFEGTTAAAILGFSRNKADILLLETGLGGRLDSTNIIEKPEVVVIAPISIDHTNFLGNTVEKIAFEKAGIIKQNQPVVISKQEFPGALKVLKEQTKKKNAKAYVFGEDWIVKKKNGNFIFEGFDKKIKLPKLSLIGEHQYINAGAAIATLFVQNKLKVDEKSITKGLQNTKWPARMQNISDEKAIKNIFKHNKNNVEIWVDGGHNQDAMKTIASFIKKENKITRMETIALIGMFSRKDSRNSIKEIVDIVDFSIATQITCCQGSRTPEEIEVIFNEFGIKNLKSKSAIEGLKLIAKKFSDGNIRVVICGSLYIAGEVLEFIKKFKK